MVRSYLLSFTAGLLASIAWISISTGLPIILSFTIFIYLYYSIAESKRHHSTIFSVTLLGFFVFNIISFSWLHKASIPGAILAIMINSFMMSLVFWLSLLVQRRTSRLTGFITLVAIWLVYEHLTMVVPYFSPWLNPGNVFGHSPQFIQWYEYTGAPGGSLWIITISTLTAISIKTVQERGKAFNIYTVFASILFIAPLTYSIYRYKTYENRGIESEVVIVQPNIDPFTEKFGSISFINQLTKMTIMAAEVITPETDWILLPETAVDDPFYERDIDSNRYYNHLNTFLADYPGTSIIVGATTIQTFKKRPSYFGNAAYIPDDSEVWHEIYNSAISVNPAEKPVFYHKSKLVPGIEQRVAFLPEKLEKLIPQLGGTMSGFGTQKNREVFENPNSQTVIAPIICYESVFGSFVNEFVHKGAEVLFIITNDGWWKNSAGYNQHLGFASIRAIENRRFVARAANTGISCVIDQKGEIVERADWWSETTLIAKVLKSSDLTYYAVHGDFIYRYADIFSIFILTLSFIAIPIKKLRVG
jgi:apolipoprotein N-acyltransferase